MQNGSAECKNGKCVSMRSRQFDQKNGGARFYELYGGIGAERNAFYRSAKENSIEALFSRRRTMIYRRSPPW